MTYQPITLDEIIARYGVHTAKDIISRQLDVFTVQGVPRQLVTLTVEVRDGC